MAATTTIKDVYALLEEVKDPEIPVLSVRDLGILRDVSISEAGKVTVVITPTYSGCPAMDTIEKDVNEKLRTEGLDVEVITKISPAWTTDWMTEEGRQKLEEYGIAPPAETTADKASLFGNSKIVRCPRCKSEETSVISHFGSTACKAMYKCDSCLETFDYFKCI
ncbi:MAG: ring-1,2-phenylacetyl-CoA epoxidase subunit PaaD [Cryomorphaceae bacterium]|jgi:ring-1,2-phenylacetyl-CoA epoxidase subunit PaaD